MKLKSLRIQNFRAFKDQTISFGDYACLVGANGAGKSTVLTALCVLFRESGTSRSNLELLAKEDFHSQDTSSPIIITATFGELSTEAAEDLKAYVRQDQLVISAQASWDDALTAAPVKQRGERLVIPAFTKYFADTKSGASAAELKILYRELCTEFTDLPSVTSKAAMEEALREYEETHPNDCELEPSDDQFYGWSKGTNILHRHIQWIFVPAVKDAGDEADETKQSVLGQLLARTVRSKVSFTDELSAIREEAIEKYKSKVAEQQGVLDELTQLLGSKIKTWAHPDADITVMWRDDDAKAVTVNEPVATMQFAEGPFKGDIARFGHGLQRSYLLALLQILAESDDDSQPTLLLGVEEPELFQHPPQARHLATVLSELSDSNSQVIVCTHSPVFLPGNRLFDIRVIRRNSLGDAAKVSSCTLNDLATRIAAARDKDAHPEMVTQTRVHQCLNPMIREMFFSPKVVLVEGIEDQAYITTWMELTGRQREFHRLGGHIIPTNGKGYMIEPLAMLELFGIPSFIVFDSDASEEDQAKREKHRIDNRALLHLCGYDTADPLPAECFKQDRVTMWSDDIGTRVENTAGTTEWTTAQNSARAKHDLHTKGMKKNPMFIGFALNELHGAGAACDALDELCDNIITFLRS